MAKLSDKVIAAIQRDIAKGKYKTGDKIPAEPELMAQYNVGRSTIREAVKTLAMSGIVRVKQGDGTYVSDKPKRETLHERLRRADATEINSVRTLLEVEIVRLAATHKTPDDIDAIAHWLDKRRKAIEQEQIKECTDADIGFHLALATASGNSVLADLYKNFTVVIRDFFDKRDAGTVHHFAQSHQLHEALFTAVKNGKPDKAAATLQQILANNN
ncbi:DNA-binding FadR family transcriptional regulator [Filimonas zeae]|uniref:GntR family transcriptional regulator n=1 Tax=Filimonas zeae TaxID=1737353 RepID=A0A917IJV0_9BACT|nr:FadR/GntR family transcriptional regulator [Filimonas zeae]MDR6337038.1 DNA-binding FadR family transcriptional regulator [Filimonas zeae]GGH56703.1 GntR family transcriptional regulator [Filimonas zeae]